MYLNIDLLQEIKNNGGFFESCGHKDCISGDKGYKLIDHAYDLLDQNLQFSNEDIIATLRKAINLRTKDIDKNIGYTNINGIKKDKESRWTMLQKLGVVKEFLLSKLLRLRNQIEYEGNDGPDLEKCHEWIDIVWYFYRSTDAFCGIVPDSFLIEYEIDGKEYFLCLDFDFKKHEKIKFRGRLPKDFVSQESYNSICVIDDYKEGVCPIPFQKKLENIYYEGSVKTANLKNYVQIVAEILKRWGI